MKPIKLLATDLDGTLLNADTEVSAENAAAIHRLTEKGIVVIPCTGRTYFDIPEAVRNHPDVRYVVYSNGAVIYDKKTDSYLRTCLSPAQNRKILEILGDYACSMEIHRNGHSYLDADEQTEETRDFYRVTPYFRAFYDVHPIFVFNLRKRLLQLDDSEMFVSFFHDDGDLLACKKRLEAEGEFLVAQSDPRNLEIFSIHAGKGNALARLSEALGSDLSETAAVGDSSNDLSMILAAGLGLATANACDTLKQAADAVICSNLDHVIPYIEAHYCANGNGANDETG